MTHVAVVGGGIAGLSAAHELLRLGATVTLLEARDRTGGKLRTTEVEGVSVEEGAESFLRRVPEALQLARDVGLDDRLVSPATSAAAVWARGALRPIPARTVLGVPADPATLAGVLSTDEVERVEQDRALPGTAPADLPGGDVAVGEWLTARLGRAVVERLVDPLLGGVYAGRADELSLAATMPMLPRDEVSALAAAARALPAAPAPGAAPQPVFATVTTGMGSLAAAVEASIRRAGGTVVTGAVVRRVERRPAGWRVVHGPTVDEQALDVDAVVVAAPPGPAAKLLATVAPAAAQALAGVETASIAIVTTLWRRPDVPDLRRSGYLVPPDAGRPVKAVTFSSTKWPHLASSGLVAVRGSLGRHREVSVLQRDDADLAELVVAELAGVAGFRGRPVAHRVSRWGGGLPQYAVGHLDLVARVRSSVAGVPGLAVCGASYDGVGIPACIRTGRQAAAQVMSRAAP